MVDDILDTEADTATLGKTAGKDAANDKPTYVSLLGVNRARELAEGCRYIELSTFPDFQKTFLNHIGFGRKDTLRRTA